MRGSVSDPRFDNVVISQGAWEALKKIVPTRPDDLAGDPLLFGVKVVVGRLLPDNVALLRLGEMVVGVLRLGSKSE